MLFGNVSVIDYPSQTCVLRKFVSIKGKVNEHEELKSVFC
jgi:ribosomal protein S18